MAITKSDTANYRGDIYLVGQNKTPFLNLIGGLNGGARVSNFTFPTSNISALSSASQDVISEDTSVTAGTPTTYSLTQATNTCQIMRKVYATSLKKQSLDMAFSGINGDGYAAGVTSLDFQKAHALKQLAVDIEYSFFQGSYVADSGTSAAAATRGIVEAISSNSVDASSAAFDRSQLDTLLATMADAGAVFDNMYIFATSSYVQAIAKEYEYVPPSRTESGAMISKIFTDFAELNLVYAPQMSANTITVVDIAHCMPVFVPVPVNEDGTGPVVDVANRMYDNGGAANSGYFYTQVGLAYGPEKYHGKIVSLA